MHKYTVGGSLVRWPVTATSQAANYAKRGLITARGAAVRYAIDDDCPTDCGHPEPAILVRRHWSRF